MKSWRTTSRALTAFAPIPESCRFVALTWTSIDGALCAVVLSRIAAPQWAVRPSTNPHQLRRMLDRSPRYEAHL